MLALLTAFILDLFIGDPVYYFHPVRIIGRAIQDVESSLRYRIKNEKVAGAILALGIPMMVFLVTGVLLLSIKELSYEFFWALNVFGIYSALSVHDLKKHVIVVYENLKEGNLDKARRSLAKIVGRDTHSLDEKEIVRAGVETVAESTVDGIVAPLFYAAIGGAPLALAYKAVNTLDSMIGHKNERYLKFGYVAAKQDELWNWIPARIAYLAGCVAAFFMRVKFKEAWHAGWKYGLQAAHGISAIPEATFAGAMGLQLGGRNSYQGRVEDRPLLGEGSRDFNPHHIHMSVNLMMATSWTTLFLCGPIIVIKDWML